MVELVQPTVVITIKIDIAFAPVFDAMKIPYQTIAVKGARKIVAGDILGLQNRIRRAVKFKKELDFLPIEAA